MPNDLPGPVRATGLLHITNDMIARAIRGEIRDTEDAYCQLPRPGFPPLSDRFRPVLPGRGRGCGPGPFPRVAAAGMKHVRPGAAGREAAFNLAQEVKPF